MKKLKLSLLVFACSLLSAPSFAAIEGGSPTVGAGELPYKNFSENAVGAGLSLGVRFNLVENIFTDLEDDQDKSSEKKSKTSDHLFTEIEAFANQFFSGQIKQNFGGRLNLGYEIKGVRIYGSGGYVASSVDYQETGGEKQSVSAGAPFFGFGLGYDITKNIGIRLNSMFYNFEFTPKNSEFKSAQVDVVATTLGLAINF